MAENDVTVEGMGVEAIAKIGDGKRKIMREIRKVIVGQDQVVEDVVTSFFAGGHCLITGVPGLAKTLLISSIGKAMHLTFRRVQFTPDLMPADITGTEILEEDLASKQRELKFRPGPVFTNILPADEIKHIDWKVYGKTDRYYIKQFEEETNLTCYILLDRPARWATSRAKTG